MSLAGAPKVRPGNPDEEPTEEFDSADAAVQIRAIRATWTGEPVEVEESFSLDAPPLYALDAPMKMPHAEEVPETWLTVLSIVVVTLAAVSGVIAGLFFG